jgi:hypothetical protein
MPYQSEVSTPLREEQQNSCMSPSARISAKRLRFANEYVASTYTMIAPEEGPKVMNECFAA